MLNILLDIILLALVVFIIIRAVKRGFVGSVFKLSKILIVLLATVLLGGMVSDLCSDMFVSSWFDGKISSQFVSAVTQGGEATSQSLVDSLPIYFRNLLPADAINKQFADFSGGAQELAVSLGKTVENALVSVISSVIGYAITFLAMFLLFSLVVLILEKFVELPVLKQINKVLGLAWGVAYAYLFVSIAVCIIGFFVDESFVASTYVLRFFNSIGLFTHG